MMETGSPPTAFYFADDLAEIVATAAELDPMQRRKTVAFSPSTKNSPEFQRASGSSSVNPEDQWERQCNKRQKEQPRKQEHIHQQKKTKTDERPRPTRTKSSESKHDSTRPSPSDNRRPSRPAERRRTDSSRQSSQQRSARPSPHRRHQDCHCYNDPLAQPPIMTVRNTNAEWIALITSVHESLNVERKPCQVPPLSSADGAKGIAQMIDHTVLKLDTTPQMVDDLCNEARKESFKAVCVRQNYVARCIGNLRGANVDVACVVGFHEGTHPTQDKVTEAGQAIAAGATELDLVINYPQLKAGEYEPIYAELAAIRSLAQSPVVLKLILETSQLTEAEIVAGCVLAASASFDFVKTSTGFNGRGASLDDVYLMHAAASELAKREIGRRVDGKVLPMSVKASGGVRSLKDAMKMIEAGANRIGTSSGIWIMQEAREVVNTDKWDRPGLSRMWPDEDY